MNNRHKHEKRNWLVTLFCSMVAVLFAYIAIGSILVESTAEGFTNIYARFIIGVLSLGMTLLMAKHAYVGSWKRFKKEILFNITP